MEERDFKPENALVYLMHKETFELGGALLSSTQVITLAVGIVHFIIDEIPLSELLVGIGTKSFEPHCTKCHYTATGIKHNMKDDFDVYAAIAIVTVSIPMLIKLILEFEREEREVFKSFLAIDTGYLRHCTVMGAIYANINFELRPWNSQNFRSISYMGSGKKNHYRQYIASLLLLKFQISKMISPCFTENNNRSLLFIQQFNARPTHNNSHTLKTDY